MYSVNTPEAVIAALNATATRISKSREASLKFLYDATIIDEKEYKKLLKIKAPAKTQ